MVDEYREGHEYVVCTECGSHILLDDEGGWLSDMWDGDPPPEDDEDDDWPEQVILFTCDWEPCLADFPAAVKRPDPPVEEGAA
ncbi:MAG: hypothetical protein K0U16_07800 [Gammaproteobacteria bacterium]|nr:hypothetical protein [Gammaproteobacteria bacterium]